VSDREKLLQTFADAAGALTTEAINALPENKRQALAEALTSGAAHVRLLVVLSPFLVIGSLHSTTAHYSIPPQVLFRIDGDLPKDGEFN